MNCNDKAPFIIIDEPSPVRPVWNKENQAEQNTHQAQRIPQMALSSEQQQPTFREQYVPYQHQRQQALQKQAQEHYIQQQQQHNLQRQRHQQMKSAQQVQPTIHTPIIQQHYQKQQQQQQQQNYQTLNHNRPDLYIPQFSTVAHNTVLPSYPASSNSPQANQSKSTSSSPQPRAEPQPAKPTEKEKEPEEKIPPIVFQCKNCFRIICDSSAYVDGSSDAEGTNFIIFSAVAPDTIDIAQDGTLSTSSYDNGSFYHAILCAHCEIEIGRYYVSTPEEMDYARQKFMFLGDKMEYYQIAEAPIQSDTVREKLKKLLNPDPTLVSQQFAMVETVLMKMHREQAELVNRIQQLEKTVQSPQQ